MGAVRDGSIRALYPSRSSLLPPQHAPNARQRSEAPANGGGGGGGGGGRWRGGKRRSSRGRAAKGRPPPPSEPEATRMMTRGEEEEEVMAPLCERLEQTEGLSWRCAFPSLLRRAEERDAAYSAQMERGEGQDEFSFPSSMPPLQPLQASRQQQAGQASKPQGSSKQPQAASAGRKRRLEVGGGGGGEEEEEAAAPAARRQQKRQSPSGSGGGGGGGGGGGWRRCRAANGGGGKGGGGVRPCPAARGDAASGGGGRRRRAESGVRRQRAVEARRLAESSCRDLEGQLKEQAAVARREREAAEHARSSEQRVSRSLEQLKSKNEELAAAMEELVSNQRPGGRWTSHDEQKRQLQAQLATAQRRRHTSGRSGRSFRLRMRDGERTSTSSARRWRCTNRIRRDRKSVCVCRRASWRSHREAKAVGEAKERRTRRWAE